MAHFLDRFLGDPHKKFLKVNFEAIAEINQLETKLANLKVAELRSEKDKLQKSLKKACPWLPHALEEKKEAILKNFQPDSQQREQEEAALKKILPLAFALVREAAKRTIKQRPFDVQLLRGIAIHGGNIAEMKTGEGKTLAATLPAFLNGLLGYGSHIITVNDYLAKRDTLWMGQIYDLLGLSISGIMHDLSILFDSKAPARMRVISRREAYLADITYGTNSEFGFDYLRDNMAASPEQISQRRLHFSIVDEVDSILIDEARTPLIISAPAEESASLYQKFARLIPRLESEKDFTVDEKLRVASLTNFGIKKMEEMLGVENVYEGENQLLAYHMEEALKAHILFQRDRDYVVKEGQVIIVDEFTGRLMPGRRYSEGLHQAIEAKEAVEVQRESDTLATISIQNYFRMYQKLSGMTGTAATEAEEFQKIYGMDVVVIPTNQDIVRKDSADRIYKTEEGKFKAIVEEIKERHALGQPILVGAISIEKNEVLSKLLNKNGIKHEILNAKNHEREAHIIANAGRKGAVTLATNMAGRGTDIILGGAKPEETKSQSANPDNNPKEFDRSDTADVEEEVEGAGPIIADRTIEDWQKEHDQVKEAGGLHVLGSERHESRRIDNQLRGRSGRQGDPGSSQFFISMEDDLMRIFGGDRMKRMMDTLGLPDDQPIENKIISRSIESAQKKVEGFNFDSRKHVVEYDDVMEKHRKTIYSKRRKILFDQKSLRPEIINIAKDQGRKLVGQYSSGNTNDWNVDQLVKDLSTIIPVSEDEVSGLKEKINQEVSDTGVEQMIERMIESIYKVKVEEIGPELMERVERAIYLQTIDRVWVDHLNAMNSLRTGIGLKAYAQTDPLVAYKQEGFYAFQRLIGVIETLLIKTIFRLRKQESEEAEAKTQRQSLLARAGVIQVGASESLAGGSVQNMVAVKSQSEALQSKSSNLSQKANAVITAVRQVSNQNSSGSAQTTPGKPTKKIGRNDPCYCGSGKKYKKCHGA